MPDCSSTSSLMARGLCRMHYSRWRRGTLGDHPAPLRGEGRICVFESCDRPHNAKGYCESHYNKWRRHGDARGRVKRTGPCIVDGCKMEQKTRWMCSKHYTRWLNHGDPLIVKRPAKRDSDERITRSGYVEIYLPGHPNAQPSTGWALEHRIVMATTLGRPLLPGEDVHHLNGQRTDNRPENLELWVSSQPAGQRPADLVGWAHEILARYEGAA